MPAQAPPNAHSVRALIESARTLAQGGRIEEARGACREALRIDPDALDVHRFLAAAAMGEERYSEAAAAFAECARLAPADAGFAFSLGLARERAADGAGALEAYLQAFRLDPRDPRLALFAGAALEEAGRLEEAVVVYSLGDDADPGMRRQHAQAGAPADIQVRSAKADRLMRAHFTALHARALDAFEAELHAEGAAAPDLARVRAAIWPQTHDRAFEYRTPRQAPDIFYMPDLPAAAVTARERLGWAGAVEGAVEAIRAEYLAAAAAGAAHSPYVPAQTRSPVWSALRGRMNWSALHLYSGAEPTAFVQAFPHTLAALEAADVVRVEAGTPIEVFFSRLQPGTHIPPHCGAANSRLTVHLPLIVPDNCAIRVGEVTHVWREGEIFAFDDSFEHEAWNRSGAERVVLIFEAHHPDLSAHERRAVEYAFAARGRWRKERRIP